MQITTQSETETRELGCRIGKLAFPGMVIALDGTLGTGKTRLTQGIGTGLGVPTDTIVSPTFTLCVPYAGRLSIWHLDAYRIRDLEEVDELALDERIEDGAVLIIEWAERIAGSLPPVDLQIQIELLQGTDALPSPEEPRRFHLASPSGKFDPKLLLDKPNCSN